MRTGTWDHYKSISFIVLKKIIAGAPSLPVWNSDTLRGALRVIARSALSIRAAHQILLSVRSSSVRKIIDFYEGDQKAWTRLLNLGSLSLGF